MALELKDTKKILGNTIFKAAQEDESIVIVSTDSGSRSGFGAFIEAYPDRYFECGIMEQGAIGVSSGLATAGKTPVFCAPAPFVTARPFEMFKNDLGYMRQNGKMIGRNCGVNYSDLGPTHLALEDIALIRLIPEVVILAPQDPDELEEALKAMLAHKGPVYLRFSSSPLPVLFEKQPFEIGKGRLIREGKDVTIISTGEITANVLQAVELLVAKGIDPQIIGMPTVKPIDTEIIKAAAQKTGRIVTVEEHFMTGGLGSAVAEVCSEQCPVPVRRIAMPDAYLSSGPYDELISYYGLDPKGIADSIMEFVEA